MREQEDAGAMPLLPDAVTDRGSALGEPGRVVRLGLLQGFQLECCENSVDLPLGSQRVLAFLALQTRSRSRSYGASIHWMVCK